MSTWFALMLLVMMAMAARGVVKPAAFLEYPAVVGLLMLGWFLPQAWSIEQQGPPWVFEPTSTWIYVLICMVAIAGGFQVGQNVSARYKTKTSLDDIERYDLGRLLIATAVTILLGALFYYLMIREAASFEPGEQWTGVITAYSFGSQLLPLGAAIALLVSVRTGSRAALMLFGIAVLIYLPVISTAVKRAPAFELAAIIAGGLFFGRRIVPPRALLIFAALVGIIVVYQAGDMRFYVKQNDATILEAFTAEAGDLSILNLEGDQVAEVQGAVSDIVIVDQGATIRPFASIWNQLVSQYVPSFIFGREVKDALTMTAFSGEGGATSRFQGYFGSTRTGFSDTYTAFGSAGALAFAFVSVLLGRLYARSLAGNLHAQLIYVVLLADGLLVITHSVAAFVAQLPLAFLVAAAVFNWSKARRRPTESVRAAAV